MNLLVAGDLFVADRFRGRPLCGPSVESLFAGADVRLVNLEAPITAGTRARPILKTGPHLCATAETVLPLLARLGVDTVTLANNHIMDYGTSGLAQTLDALRTAGIRTVGAGMTLEEADRALVIEGDAGRIAVVNFCENEWANAGPGRPGANPMAFEDNIERIREARRTCDRVIVVVHGGQEDFHYPTPRMIKRYRFYAANGASVVVGHHQHCVSGYEVHQGAPIFYGIGNFLFTMSSSLGSWYTGLVLKLRFEAGRPLEWELVPVAQAREDYTLTRLEGEARERVLREIEGYSRVIADGPALQARWERFLAENARFYL
ncbi:MAG TPA: CapA family protein, partial [Candidatus Bathyarchaeia archaeon]|nr:CapA family protein [Candidatus Bathyarchaeia archaeon]